MIDTYGPLSNIILYSCHTFRRYEHRETWQSLTSKFGICPSTLFFPSYKESWTWISSASFSYFLYRLLCSTLTSWSYLHDDCIFLANPRQKLQWSPCFLYYYSYLFFPFFRCIFCLLHRLLASSETFVRKLCDRFIDGPEKLPSKTSTLHTYDATFRQFHSQ